MKSICSKILITRISVISIFISVFVGSLLQAQENAFLVDTSVTYIPTQLGQSFPAVAFDGNNYFVFWYDMRHGMQYHSDGWSYWHYYGCRVNTDGVLVDSSGVLISYAVWVAGWIPYKLAITYGGGKYLCAWSDFRDSYMLYGARIDTNGTVLDPDGFPIAALDSWKDPPAVAFDGVNYFVVWWDARDPSGIYGCRIHPDGTILDPQGLLISSPGGGAVSVTYDGNNYFVVWSSYPGSDIYGVRVDTSGTVVDSNAIAICTEDEYQLFPSVTYGEGYYFAVWLDERFGPTNADIYGARIDTTGILVDTNSIQISISQEYDYFPTLSFDGTNYLVAWSDYAATYCARVNTNGILLDSLPITVAQDTIYEASTPWVASDGVNSLIVYHTGWSYGDIFGSRVDASGGVLDTNGILLSMIAHSGRTSSSAFDGVNYLTVWTDFRDTSASYIYGTRVDTAGMVLDPIGIDILRGKEPSIAFDGTNYLLTGSDTDITGVRIDNTGAVLDTTTIYSIYPDRCNNPAVIFDGDNYFVTFEAWPQYGPHVYGVRVDTSGVVLDTNGIEITQGGAYDLCPQVAFDGANYLVVWFHGTHQSTFDIYGARINSMGVLVDTIPIIIASGSYRQWYPSIAFDGTNYLVVWQDNRSGVYGDIYGTRVTPSGVVLDPSGIPICTATSGQYKPRIGFDGQNYCVIWEDWRNGNYTDVYGCYITPGGQVIEEFVVSDQPNLQVEPNLIRGLDRYLITYSGFIDSINSRPTNTLRIQGQFRQFTGVEEDIQTKTQVTTFGLQVYPNPVHQECVMRYSIPTRTRIQISMYDVTGRLCRELLNEIQDIGIHREIIDMTVLPQGVYFIKLQSSSQSRIQKIIFLK